MFLRQLSVVVEFFEVVVNGCRQLQVVSRFSNFDYIMGQLCQSIRFIMRIQVKPEISNQSTRNVHYLPVCCLFASNCFIITGNKTPKVVARPMLTVCRTVAQKHTRQDQALSCCRRGRFDGTDITSKDECTSFVIVLYQQINIQNQESDIVLLQLQAGPNPRFSLFQRQKRITKEIMTYLFNEG